MTILRPLSKPILFLFLGLSMLAINPRINGWNEASRMALTQSLVEQHSFSIDESVFVSTGDKVFIGNHFYSDKPPLPSILAALVYYPLYHAGFELEFGWNLAYFLIILLTVKLFWLLSVLAFNQSMEYTPTNIQYKDWLVLIFAFTSLSFTWSATFNNHSLAGSSLMIAFLFYLKGISGKEKYSLLWSGLFLGLAGAMDIPTSIFFIGFGILVFINQENGQKFMLFLLGGLVPIGVHLGVNYSIGGTLLPLQIIPEFFNYEGSSWISSDALSGVETNSLYFTLKYASLSMLGPRGFLWYNPFLFLLIPLAIRAFQQKGHLRAEAAVILSCSMILLSYYFVFSSNFGGWSYSIRWFVPILPLLYIFIYDLEFIVQMKHGKHMLYGLIGTSLLIAIVGQINPWSSPEYHSVPFIANLQQLMGLFF